jgi:hypothetical protein
MRKYDSDHSGTLSFDVCHPILSACLTSSSNRNSSASLGCSLLVILAEVIDRFRTESPRLLRRGGGGGGKLTNDCAVLPESRLQVLCCAVNYLSCHNGSTIRSLDHSPLWRDSRLLTLCITLLPRIALPFPSLRNHSDHRVSFLLPFRLFLFSSPPLLNFPS